MAEVLGVDWDVIFDRIDQL